MAAHSSILSCLENSMDRGAWWATVCGVAKSQYITDILNRGFLVVKVHCFVILRRYNNYSTLGEVKKRSIPYGW